MPWIIANGNYYIARDARNHVVATSNIKNAVTFYDRKRVEQFCNNLPKAFKNLNYCSIFVSDDKIDPEASDGDTIQEHTTAEQTQRQRIKTEIASKNEPAVDIPSVDLFIAKTSDFSKFVIEASSKRSAIQDALNRVDLEIMDIEHAIEFSHCNVVGGYQWYRMLREARERRRKYKDAIACIDILANAQVTSTIQSDPLKRLNGLKTRKYAPRVLTDLVFEQ